MSDEPQTTRRGPVLVSACLLGLRTRYDGGSCERARAVALSQTRCVVPVCPEQLGGLPTPRLPSEIAAGDGRAVLEGAARVVRADGRDVTAAFIAGAEAAATIAEVCGVREAWLKEGSPSCGVDAITRGGARSPGSGVTAALLRAKGIRVVGIA